MEHEQHAGTSRNKGGRPSIGMIADCRGARHNRASQPARVALPPLSATSEIQLIEHSGRVMDGHDQDRISCVGVDHTAGTMKDLSIDLPTVFGEPGT